MTRPERRAAESGPTATQAAAAEVVHPKITLAGWRTLIDHEPVEPALLDRARYDALGPDARAGYDDARLRYFGEGIRFETQQLKDLTRAVRAALRTSGGVAAGASPVVVVDGPAHVGKTTALVRCGQMIERGVANRHPDYRSHGIVPVVYVAMPPNATATMVADTVLAFFGVQRRRQRRSDQVIHQAISLMRERQTRVLIVDEFQKARLQGATGAHAINALKAIMNDAGVVTVIGGVNLRRQLTSEAAEQIVERAFVHPMDPFTLATDVAREDWAALVDAFVDRMLLIDGPTETPGDWADILHVGSRGRIGTLHRILRMACDIVIEEKATPTQREVITEQILRDSIGAQMREQPRPPRTTGAAAARVDSTTSAKKKPIKGAA